jgi:hypothetical protein
LHAIITYWQGGVSHFSFLNASDAGQLVDGRFPVADPFA